MNCNELLATLTCTLCYCSFFASLREWEIMMSLSGRITESVVWRSSEHGDVTQWAIRHCSLMYGNKRRLIRNDKNILFVYVIRGNMSLYSTEFMNSSEFNSIRRHDGTDWARGNNNWLSEYRTEVRLYAMSEVSNPCKIGTAVSVYCVYLLEHHGDVVCLLCIKGYFYILPFKHSWDRHLASMAERHKALG